MKHVNKNENNEVVIETKNQLIAKINKFHKSKQSSLIIDNIPYRTYLELFSNIKPMVFYRNGMVRVRHYLNILFLKIQILNYGKFLMD